MLSDHKGLVRQRAPWAIHTTDKEQLVVNPGAVWGGGGGGGGAGVGVGSAAGSGSRLRKHMARLLETIDTHKMHLRQKWVFLRPRGKGAF